VLWKQTALSRACFKSQQKSLLRRLYQYTMYTSAGGARDKTPDLFYVFRSREVTLGVGSNSEIGFW